MNTLSVTGPPCTCLRRGQPPTSGDRAPETLPELAALVFGDELTVPVWRTFPWRRPRGPTPTFKPGETTQRSSCCRDRWGTGPDGGAARTDRRPAL